MSSDHVRVSSRAKSAAATRRRPRQSRAQASSLALQQAFVRVLLERGSLSAVTVREVAAVAGVGVGTFYEYVANMKALAALTIHLRVKALGQGLAQTIAAHAGQPLDERVTAMLDHQIQAVMEDAPAWAALFRLEREVSSPEAYNKHYEDFVALWASALLPALANPLRRAAVARMAHCLVYGAVTQALLTQGPGLDRAALRAELRRALQAYLDAALD